VNTVGKTQALVALALLGAGLVVAGCNSKPELTNQQAQSLIQAKYNTLDPQPVDIAINDRGMQQGVTAGYWTGLKRYPNGYWGDFKLTPNGAKALKLSAGGDVIQWRPSAPQDPHYAITVQSLGKVKLKASGVQDPFDDGDNKTTAFTEEMDLTSLPAPLADMAHNPGNQLSSKKRATFVLNNGTWALDSIK
jgi:hypothetical protein